MAHLKQGSLVPKVLCTTWHAGRVPGWGQKGRNPEWAGWQFNPNATQENGLSFGTMWLLDTDAKELRMLAIGGRPTLQ